MLLLNKGYVLELILQLIFFVVVKYNLERFSNTNTDNPHLSVDIRVQT